MVFLAKGPAQAIGLGLSRVVQKIESASGATTEALVLFECSFRRALFFAILENNKALRNFYGSEHNENIKHFRDLDVQLAKLSCDMIRARLAAGVPGATQLTTFRNLRSVCFGKRSANACGIFRFDN